MGAYPKGAHRGLQLVGVPAAHTLKGEARVQIFKACSFSAKHISAP